MLHAPMDYLDCACFTGRTSIPIRCIVERVSSNGNATPPSSPTSNVTPNISSPTTTVPSLSLSTTTSTTTTTTQPTVTTLVPATSPNATSGSQLTVTSETPTQTNQPNETHTLEANGSSALNPSTNLPESSLTDSPQTLPSVLQSTSPLSSKISTCSKLQISTDNLIPPSTTTSPTLLSNQTSIGDKSSGEGGFSLLGSESIDTKAVCSTTTTNTTVTSPGNAVNNCNNIDEDDDLDVNPANPNDNKNIETISTNQNSGSSVNITDNVSTNGDTSVNLSLGDKLINGKNNESNCNSNQRHLTNSSPSLDLSTNNNNNSNNSSVGCNNTNNGGGHCQAINVSLSQQLSPSSALRSLFGLNHYPFQANHLNHNLSHLQHHNHNHHTHHLLTSHLDHSSSINSNQQSGDSGNHSSTSSPTFPASISPSGVVEQDSFAIITSGLLFSNLVKTALLHLGYPESEISGAKGFIQLRNWKPLTLDQITDSVDATVGDIMGDISSIASLRIILHRPRTSGPNEIEDKLLQVLLAQSYSLLANSGNPVDQTLLAALMGRNNRLEAELNDETRGKFDQWYMQQVFNQYRQMATLAAAQAHHQQAAAAAAAVMAATNQQQKQAAAAALAAVVNAAAASAGSTASGNGSVDGSGVNETLTRNRGAAAAAAAAAAAVAAAANCQSLLNLDMDAASLASNASASSHSNHLKDNHHHHSSKHHSHDHHHHTRGPSSSSSSHLLSTGRSSESNSGVTGGSSGAGARLDSSASSVISSSGTTNLNSSNSTAANNGNSNSNINRSSPNAPGQYVRTRIRTSFDPEMELPKLHKWFSENQHPSRAQIQQYVKELNSLESRRGRKPLDVNNVVYWFKNARAAHKRHELKLVNGSQSPTLSNNNTTNVNNNSNNLINSSNLSNLHCRDPYEARINLGSGRSGRGLGLMPGLMSDRLSGLSGLTSGNGGNGTSGNEPYADSNGNEDLLMGQMYDDDGSEAGQDDYEGDDMMMDDDCSQISQTLDLSVRPMKRQRSDSSPPGSPISGPSSLSDLIRGTPPHTLASASSCHSNFNVKDEPASDEEDEEDYDDMDERDYYPVVTSRHGLSLTSGNHGGISSRSGDVHNLSGVTSNYLGIGSESINGMISETGGRHNHHSTSSHDRHHHHSSSSSNLNNGASSGSHGQPDSPEEGRRIRRSRTFIDPTTEVPKLEQWFSLCTHPNHPQIVSYTDELNSSPYRLKYPKLEPKNIQFWFKNRRAKSKRQNLPISSSNTSPLTTSVQSGSTSTNTNNNQLSSSSSSSSTSGPVTTTTTSSSPSIASNCSVSSLSLSTSTGPVSTSVSSSALTIDRLIGH
ncbi:cell wall protein DAN4-like [Tetranychus urticae]|uniref:Homeobox domain-containing protein n=1 Tax=Tetranychus urticae TaxID=32264 RepID=T1KTH8_TETUR|nr:cell wall protein DAN4-like [Tetranychus urticae]